MHALFAKVHDSVGPCNGGLPRRKYCAASAEEETVELALAHADAKKLEKTQLIQ